MNDDTVWSGERIIVTRSMGEDYAVWPSRPKSINDLNRDVPIFGTIGWHSKINEYCFAPASYRRIENKYRDSSTLLEIAKVLVILTDLKKASQ